MNNDASFDPSFDCSRAIDATPTPAATPIQWWRDAATVQRLVTDLITAEFAQIRPSGARLPPRPWPASLHIANDIGADSLELLQLATALAEMLHLHESGIEDFLLARPTIADWVDIARSGLDMFNATLTFRTSGSTGVPKRCTHSLADLWQEVLQLATLLQARRRVFSAVPSHHIYGFIFTVLLPHALGLNAADVIDLRGGSPARLRTQLSPGDLVIGHPTFWQAAVNLLPGLAADVVGVSSTAPCPDALSTGLRAVGLGQLVQIFGSSETAGIGWRDCETAPFKLFDHWQRDAQHADALRRTAPDGSVQRIAYPDALIWHDERHFMPGVRRDAGVQVGGINVFPSAVRSALLTHPAVRDAAVRLMRSDEGNRLKAFIVPHDAQADRVALHADLTAWVQQQLTAAERPRAFTFGERCPIGPNGKDADWII